MNSMFNGCSGLTSLNLSNFNTEKVTDMNRMFEGCSGLTELDLSKFNTENVNNMCVMFQSCSSLTSLNLSNFNTAKVTDMRYMFNYCSSLTSLTFGEYFTTANVTDMTCMFESCSSLTSLDVTHFNTENVTTMDGMFVNCRSLTRLDVSNFNTANVTKMNSMFYGCSGLTSLTFGKNFTTASCISYGSMFYGCSRLRYLDFYASNDVDAINSVDRNTEGDICYGVPKTTVIYLPKGSQAVSNVVNVVYSYNGDGNDLRCPNYYSEDKVEIELPREFKTAKAEYSRTMNAATQYGTVILPYEFTTNESVQAYLLRAEHTGTMWYEEVESVQAHTPFFYSKKTASDTNVNFNKTVDNYGITVAATHTTSKAEGDQPYDAASGMDGWTTKGYYITDEIDATPASPTTNTFYIAGDKFWRATGTLKMYPHRVTYQGQWQYEPNATEAPAMLNIITMGASETGDDVPSEVSTAIEAAHLRSLQQNARDIYDAQGRRQSELKSGLNIVRMADGTTVKIVKR
jgi:surface protein